MPRYLEKRARGEGVEDTFFEVIGFAVVKAQDGQLVNRKEMGQPPVQLVRGAIDAAHRASDTYNSVHTALDRVKDASNVAARRVQDELESAGFIGRGSRYVEDAEVEVGG